MAAAGITSALRCSGCRLGLPRSLVKGSQLPSKTSSAAIVCHTSVTRALRNTSEIGYPSQSRNFTSTRIFSAESELQQPDTAGNGEPAFNADSNIPWYLRNQSQDTEDGLESRAPSLPSLPPNPPPLLQPFLEHLVVELGLDDLVLLDLRELDPPPALGSNLIMVIGSARSEKHLHVSADRFSRWLRSTYKLRAHAAGLLGRNELKIKMRRRAKRARLMSNVGASETSRADDDGIRTGWICVTMDRVPDGPRETPTVEQNFVGFSSGLETATIVIQLFTHEVRNNVDLERLWERILARHNKRKEEMESDGHGSVIVEVEVDEEAELPTGVLTSSAVSEHIPSLLEHPIQQTRGYHTISGRRPLSPLLNQISRRYFTASHAANVEDAVQVGGLGSGREFPIFDQTKYQISSEQALDTLLKSLRSVPSDEARSLLGHDWKDRESTTFLQDFYSNIPVFMESRHWTALSGLWMYAIHLAHPGYPPESLLSLIEKMQVDAFQPTEELLLNSLRAILSPEHSHGSKPWDLSHRLSKALDILQTMETYDYPILREDIFLYVHRAITTPSGTTQQADEQERALQRSRFREVVNVFDLMPRDESSIMALMKSYAQLGDWNGFWDLWYGFPARMLPRSSHLYKTVFEETAASRNSKQCKKAVVDGFAGLEIEAPEVELDKGMARAVLECLMVLDPEATGDESTGPFRAIYADCKRALQADA